MKQYIYIFCTTIGITQLLISSECRLKTPTACKRSPALQKYIDRAQKDKSALGGAFWSSFWDQALSRTHDDAKAARKTRKNRPSRSRAFLQSAAINVPETAYNSYQMHQDIGLSNPFADDLMAFNDIIDQSKTVIIGGKEYMIHHAFHNLEGTGYQEKKLTIPATYMTNDRTNKNQYELYIMPSTPQLVAAFDLIACALQQSTHKHTIAFMALRPTPSMHNNAHQTLPRIIIVFKDNATAPQVEDVARSLYITLKEAKLTIPVGYWPRYSERIQYKDSAIKRTIAEQMHWLFFVGIGNSDYKTIDPESFERKQILGLPRQGDRAYPKHTAPAKKIGIITIEKSSNR